MATFMFYFEVLWITLFFHSFNQTDFDNTGGKVQQMLVVNES